MLVQPLVQYTLQTFRSDLLYNTGPMNQSLDLTLNHKYEQHDHDDSHVPLDDLHVWSPGLYRTSEIM